MEYYCMRYQDKWLCPPKNDLLDCKDCIYSTTKEKLKGIWAKENIQPKRTHKHVIL